MIDWNYIQDFLGFVLTGAISLLGVLGIVAVTFGIILLVVGASYIVFTHIEERLK